MNRRALIAAVALVLCALTFAPAQAGCEASRDLMGGDSAANRRQYERYLASVQGIFPSPSGNFVLDERAFAAVQGIFDRYVRSRIARLSLQRFDNTDITVAGSAWSLEQSLAYLLQHGTPLGRKMAALNAGISEADDAKMMRLYKEDDFRFAESFWGLTGQKMVDHARVYYNVGVGQLNSTLVSTPYGTFRGQYYNPNFLNIRIFLDHALRNYQICLGNSAGR